MPAQRVGSYLALALQVPTNSVAGLGDRSLVRQAISTNITEVRRALQAGAPALAEAHGLPVRLVVLPEYVLTGAPTPGPFEAWRNLACLEPQGSEYDALAEIAIKGSFFLAGNVYESDPNFPQLYFQCSFVINPSGDLILRYRRLISLYSPTPYDVWERYLDLYGLDGIYPVADTEIGRLAAVASEEILYPEIARCHVLRGAEILVHSTSEMGSPRATTKELARQARAVENACYLVSANTAGVPDSSLPARSSTGMSKIVDFTGQILAAAPPGGATLGAHAILDVESLRERRRRTGLHNTLSRLPLQAFAASFEHIAGRAANELSQEEDASRSRLQELQAATVVRLDRAGRL